MFCGDDSDCSSACSRRCKEASRKKRCTRACKSCCMRCHCVPPGTYGHKNACPCYARLKTHGNKLKCPWTDWKRSYAWTFRIDLNKIPELYIYALSTHEFCIVSMTVLYVSFFMLHANINAWLKLFGSWEMQVIRLESWTFIENCQLLLYHVRVVFESY